MAKENKSKEIEAEEKLRIKEQKLKDEKRRKRLNAAKKKIDVIVKTPLKILFNSSILVAIITFVFFYFWMENDLTKSLIYVFFVFTSVYLGVGITMVIYYYLLSEEKIKELNEKVARESKKRDEEEKLRQTQEMEELEAIEREMLERRAQKKNEDENEKLSTQPSIDNIGEPKSNQINEDDYLNEILGNEFQNNS